MGEKKPFSIHIEETRHFRFEVWAETKIDALEEAQRIWREAPTTGQWELPDTDTGYHAVPITPHVRQTTGSKSSDNLTGLALDMGRVIRSLDAAGEHSELWTQDGDYIIDGRFPR